MFYGGTQLSASTFEVTRWFVILCIPIIPLSTWEIIPGTVETVAMRTRRGFHIVAKRKLNLMHVLIAYLSVMVGFTPLVLFLFYFTGGADLFWAIAMVAWAVVPLGIALYRYDRIFKQGGRRSSFSN